MEIPERVKVELVEWASVLRLTVDGRAKYVTLKSYDNAALKTMLDVVQMAFNMALATGQATADEIFETADEMMADKVKLGG